MWVKVRASTLFSGMEELALEGLLRTFGREFGHIRDQTDFSKQNTGAASSFPTCLWHWMLKALLGVKLVVF